MAQDPGGHHNAEARARRGVRALVAERVRLARLALAAAAQVGPADAAAYAKMPVQQDELGHDADEMLAWDAEGWEDIP